MLEKIFITGATGFVGQHLLNELAKLPGFQMRILTRKSDYEHASAESVIGDLTDANDVRSFINSSGVLVNLAFDGVNLASNTVAAQLLVDSAKEAGIRRIIHLSTATVTGRTSAEIITEDSEIYPFTDYEKSKAEVEAIFRKAAKTSEVVLLRPTAIFGAGGKNLVKVIRDRLTKNSFLIYLFDSVFAKRSLHLVPVEFVVQVILKSIMVELKQTCATYIVSYDDSPSNNYSEITQILDSKFQRRRIVPRLFFLNLFLPYILKFRTRSSISGKRKYISNKINELELERPDFNLAVGKFLNHQLKEMTK